MPIRSLRLVSVCAVSLLALPDLSYAQATPPAAAAQPAPAAPGATQPPPSETFDLNRALVSEGGGLSSDEAAKLAVARSYQVESSQAAAESARWDAKAQWANFLPTLTVFGQYKRVSDVPNELSIFPTPTPEQAAMFAPETLTVLNDFKTLFQDSSGTSFTQPPNNYSTGATLRIPVSDLFLRIWPAYAGSSTLADARKIQVEGIRADIELRAREAFYGYARAIAFRAVAEQALKQADAQARQITLFVNAGTAAPVDLMQATARLEGARASLARADGSLAVARTALATVTGLKPSEIAAIGEPVATLPEGPKQSSDLLVNRALQERAELRALRKVAGASESMQTAEKNAAWPQLMLEGNALYANPNPRYIPPVTEFNYSWDVSATLSWSPNQAVTGHARGKRAEADVAKARADILALQDAVQIEVVQAYEDYKSADAAARSSESALAAAEEAYRVRLVMYGVGAGVAMDLLDADFQLTQARLQHISSVLDARTALARLDRAAVLSP